MELYKSKLIVQIGCCRWWQLCNDPQGAGRSCWPNHSMELPTFDGKLNIFLRFFCSNSIKFDFALLACMEMGTSIGSRLYIGVETCRIDPIERFVCGRTIKRSRIPRWCDQCCARLWCNRRPCNCNASRHSKSCIHWINRSGPINCRTCGEIQFEESLTRTWRYEQNLEQFLLLFLFSVKLMHFHFIFVRRQESIGRHG